VISLKSAWRRNSLNMDKDIELQKIQAINGYFQTRITTAYAFLVSFIVGFLIFLGTLYYQGVFNIIPETSEVFLFVMLAKFGNILIFSVVIIAVGYGFARRELKSIHDLNDRCFAIITDLLLKVENGETIPPLSELKKMVKKDNKKLKRNNHSSEVELESNTDRELQIKIAQLNAKLKVCLAAVFGFIALAGAFILAGYQLALGAIRTEPINSFEVYISVLFFGVAGIVTVAALSYWLKLRECAKEIDNLK
jgi:hypothetical protein